MSSPPIYNGGYEGEEWVNYARDGFDELLDTSMLCDNVELITSDFSVITPAKAVVQSVTENTALKLEDRQILVPIGTLTGEIVYSYVRFDGVVWLIDSEPTNNKFYEKAPLKLCNNQLRWQDSETKIIKEYWYWAEDVTRYSSGVFKGNLVIQYDKQYSIHLPMDIHTRKLHDGMRFMMEKSDDMPLVCKLTKFDGITGNNKTVKVLKLTLTQTVYDKEVDNADLMIADYYARSPESESVEYNCRIDFKSDEIAVSSFGEFTAFLTDNEGSEIDTPIVWNITSDEFDVSCLKITDKGSNTIRIAVKNDKSLIGKTFDLNATLDENILAIVKVSIIPLW